jgi:hypothetical protein
MTELDICQEINRKLFKIMYQKFQEPESRLNGLKDLASHLSNITDLISVLGLSLDAMSHIVELDKIVEAEWRKMEE